MSIVVLFHVQFMVYTPWQPVNKSTPQPTPGWVGAMSAIECTLFTSLGQWLVVLTAIPVGAVTATAAVCHQALQRPPAW